VIRLASVLKLGEHDRRHSGPESQKRGKSQSCSGESGRQESRPLESACSRPYRLSLLVNHTSRAVEVNSNRTCFRLSGSGRRGRIPEGIGESAERLRKCGRSRDPAPSALEKSSRVGYHSSLRQENRPQAKRRPASSESGTSKPETPSRSIFPQRRQRTRIHHGSDQGQ
jgi:hypothetical protein